MKPFPSLRSGLLRHRLDNELLVYNAEADQIHLLNASTAEVVDMMDKGETADSIATKLGSGKPEAGAEMLALALDELAIAGLVEDKDHSPWEPVLGVTTRRQMVQRLATASAMLLIPAVVSLSPGKASAQTTGTRRSNGSPCAVGTDCLSGCCGANSGGLCTINQCQSTTQCPGKNDCK